MGRGKFLRSLKQRWWLVAVLVIPITLGTMFYTILKKAEYEAFMTLADRRERDIGVPAIYTQDLMGGSVNEQEIRVLNLANTLSSFTVLKSAYDELRQSNTIPRDLTESEFMSKVTVNPLRGTEYLQVSYVATNAEDARKVIDTIRDKFRLRYSQLNTRAGETRAEFIREQLKVARAAYNAKLQEQKEFQEKFPNAAAFEVSTSGLVGRLNLAQQRLDEADKNLAAAVGIYTTAKQQVANAGKFVTPEGVQRSPNPIRTEILSRVAGNEARLQALLQTKGNAHPDVIATRELLEADKATLRNTDEFVYSNSKSTESPYLAEAKQAMYAAERALMSARADRANAMRNITALEAEKDKLPIIQKELTALNAEILAKAEDVRNLTSKLSEAEVRTKLNEQPTIYMLDDPMYREVPRGTVLKTAVALFLSLVVAVSLIASLGQIDQGTYTPIEAENSLGFPVIAVLPRSGQQRLSTGQEQATALAASYQILSTEIMSLKEKLVGPGILVAAAEPNVGRSTVAANLAISLARDGARVLLIDSDLRDPSLHTHFGLENRAGLSEVLQGSATVENVVQPTGVDGLLFIAAGQPPVNPVRLLRGEQMDQFIELVSKGADYIIFDSPAGSTFGDASVLAANVQNVVLVHEAGRAPSVAEYEFHKSLERLGINVIGMVLNKARPDDCPAYQHFRKNYEATLGRYRPSAGPAALGSGDKPVRERPTQYGARDDDEE